MGRIPEVFVQVTHCRCFMGTTVGEMTRKNLSRKNCLFNGVIASDFFRFCISWGIARIGSCFKQAIELIANEMSDSDDSVCYEERPATIVA